MKSVMSYPNKLKPTEDSIRQLMEEYMLDLEAANKSPKTISRYMYSFRSLICFLESKKLSIFANQIGKNEINQYTSYLRNSKRWPNRHNSGKDYGRLSPHTIQGHIRDIKAFWSWLTREGHIENNPLAKYSLPSVPHYIIPTLSNDQMKTLLSAIDRSTPLGAKYYCILTLLFDTGLRISELISIRVQDLDLTSGLVTIIGKGQKERIVPFSRRARKQLRHYIVHFRQHLCSEDCHYLFAANNEHISVNSVQQYMRRLARKAGLDGIKCFPHILRHTFATQSIARGASTSALKDIMGHSSSQTTMKYVHLSVEDLKSQHNKFSPLEGLLENES